MKKLFLAVCACTLFACMDVDYGIVKSVHYNATGNCKCLIWFHNYKSEDIIDDFFINCDSTFHPNDTVFIKSAQR